MTTKDVLPNLDDRRLLETAQQLAHEERHATVALLRALTVRRQVWQRDGGRCAFVGTRGRCRETTFLEFHHVEPYSVGGDATADNIALRCRAHNTHEARLYFGEPPSEQAVTTHHE